MVDLNGLFSLLSGAKIRQEHPSDINSFIITHDDDGRCFMMKILIMRSEYDSISTVLYRETKNNNLPKEDNIMNITKLNVHDSFELFRYIAINLSNSSRLVSIDHTMQELEDREVQAQPIFALDLEEEEDEEQKKFMTQFDKLFIGQQKMLSCLFVISHCL